MIVARGYITLTNIQGSANLLDWQSQWREGSLPAGWSLNGVAEENSIVLRDNPFATKALMWKSTPIRDGSNNSSGGFWKKYIDLDNKHTYRYTCFYYIAKRTIGGIFHGTGGVENLDGTANTNPYFLIDYSLPVGQWLLVVGYIHPNKATTSWAKSDSGAYDLTGKKLARCTDYKTTNNLSQVSVRSFQYGTDNPEDIAYFYNPRLEVCDGNEPSIEQLLQVSTREEIDAVKVEYKSEIQKLDNKIAFSVSEVKSYTDNKATSEALKAVENVQFGGRNLYKKSTVISTLSGSITKTKEADTDSKNGFKLTGSQGSLGSVRIFNVIPGNGDYIISFWGKCNVAQSTLKFDICDRVCTGDSTFTQEWKRFELKAVVNNFSTIYNFIDIADIDLVQYWFKDFKVESGNKATDWSPAPEDVTADAQAKADAARVAAEAVAIAKAELAKTTAQAYADGKVTAEEQRAIADAQAKLNEAKADAQAKANAAQTAATAAAAVDATNRVNTLKQETNAQLTILSNQIEQRVTKTVFDNAISDAQLLAKAMSRGLMLYDDPTFKKGLNSIRAYNNAANASVVITREQIAGIPNDSGYGLKIVIADGNANPPLGGFYFGTATKANKVMVCRFVAKVPENQRIAFTSNSYGTGGVVSKWLTSNVGTGKWEEYAYYLKCGETGTFSSTFFFYLNIAPDQTFPITWHLAYATVYDLNANEVFTPRAEYEAKITVLENSITSKVSQSTFDSLGNRVTAAESTITQHSNQIASKVSQSTFDALGNRVTAAESSITQMPTQIALAVSTSEEKIKTSLTLDSTGISLLGKKIALTGVVTFSALASDAQNKVNTAQSTANTASSKADAAQSTANSAVSKADTAQSGLTALIGKLGDLSYEDMVGIAKLDTTIIEGGFIKTNLIDANAIITNSLLAEKIAATDITTSRLTVTTGAMIGGWSVEGNSLITRSENSAKLLVEVSGTKFLRVNDLNTMLYIRSDGDNKKGISISTFGNSTALDITANGYGYAIESAGSHRMYQRSGEVWNTPGVLWAGRINANGGVQNHWGDGCSVSSANATAVGFYDIYHNLGRTDYFVMVTPTPYTVDGDQQMTAMIGNKSSNYFTVVLVDVGGRNRRCAFELAIIGRNKL